MKTLERFTILYTENFNPNSSALIVFREGVKKEHLGPYLVSLCKQFYENTDADITPSTSKEIVTAATATQQPTLLYQCRHCFTVYDERLGEPEQQILSGTAFQELPSSYCCPLCDANKEDFVLMNSQLLSTA